jgi:hypothetical protein
MPDPIYVTAFLNEGLVPAVDCVRCPSCRHEMPLADVQVLAALDADAGFACRCGLRLHLAPTADVVVFSDAEADPVDAGELAKAESVRLDAVKRSKSGK